MKPSSRIALASTSFLMTAGFWILYRCPKDEVTNCAFGGEDLKTLFITAGGSLWSIPVDTPGRVTFLP